jgi:hypothetical protein
VLRHAHYPAATVAASAALDSNVDMLKQKVS